MGKIRYIIDVEEDDKEFQKLIAKLVNQGTVEIVARDPALVTWVFPEQIEQWLEEELSSEQVDKERGT